MMLPLAAPVWEDLPIRTFGRGSMAAARPGAAMGGAAERGGALHHPDTAAHRRDAGAACPDTAQRAAHIYPPPLFAGCGRADAG